jgi:uncharacterized protein YjbI with pentapeptide repeats
MIGGTNYSGTSLKPNRRWRPEFLLLGLMLLMKMDISMAFFFNKVLDAGEFLGLLNDLPQGSISDRQIKRTTLEKQELPDQPLENLYFKSCKWHGVDAHAKTLKNIIFEDCEFNDVNMRGIKLDNVQFISSTLTNVVMNKADLKQVKFRKSKLISTDPNIDNSYNGIQADEILFDGCELRNIGFYRGKGVFRFENSTLYDVAGQSLSAGSALYFNKTHASILNFDRSNLNTIEIIDSTIDKRSTAGGGQVKTIRVENSELEFAVSNNNNVESIKFKNSGDVVVGRGENVKTTRIQDCPKGTYVVRTGGVNFDVIEVENCDVAKIVFGRSTGKTVIIKNVTTHDMDFRESNIEHLILENVQVRSYIEYTKTQVKDLTLKNVSFRKGIEIYKEGSNIEITPDSWVEE